MFYKIFKTLCDKKGITPTAAGREIGIPQQNVSMWKMRNSVPRPKTLLQIARYFNVELEALLEE